MSSADQDGADDKPSLGDLLSDKDGMRRRREAVPAERVPLDHRIALTGLAALAGVDPGEVIRAYEEDGGPLARLIEGLLHLAPRGRGRPALDDKIAAERYAVVEMLKACGLEGRPLKKALEEVGTGNVTTERYMRAAREFKGNKLAALFVDTDAVRRAQARADRHREIWKK